ncbi:MAG: SulP family inorganic anion transporter [Pirellulales bacterium]|nr:SulP family inorganic anion transporter [Pirellulales bacterium]
MASHVQPSASLSASGKHETGLSRLRRDFSASIVVFLVALPLCMGLALAAGVPVGSGLITGIIGGLIVGSLTGSPLQVSGPGNGVIVVVYDLVQQHGLPMLGIVVLGAGVLQLLAGTLRLGQWFRAVSPAVIQGMLAGIGILIAASQFHVMVDDKPQGNGLQNLVTLPRAIQNGLPWPTLGNRGDRDRKLFLLQQAGALHEHQAELQELVAEHIARDSKSAETTALDSATLDSWIERQSHITSQLGELLAMAERDREADPRKRGELPAVASQAYRAAQDALDELDSKQIAKLNDSQAAAVAALAELLAQLKNHDWAAKVGLLTIAIIVLWRGALPNFSKVIPPPLVAILVATLIAGILKLPVLYVEVPDRLADAVHVTSWSVLAEAPVMDLLPFVFVIALVTSAETLLCATAVDRLHNGPRTRYDRELAAQGFGNVLCGLLGALPMTGVIIRSAVNVSAGARTRLSTMLHGLWILLFVSVLGFLLRFVPTSALAAILVYTGYKLIDFKALRELWAYGKGEVLVYSATLVLVVSRDLLTGVCVGVVLSAAKLLYDFSRLTVRVERARQGKVWTVRLAGAATFLQLPKLAEALDSVPADVEARVVCERLRYIDHACLEVLTDWTKRRSAHGANAKVDWEYLQQRARDGSPAKPAAEAREQVLVESSHF